jgi:phosphatidylinositol glycan class W
MDIGIGSFIASSAFTSRFARGHSGETNGETSSDVVVVFGIKFTSASLQKLVVLLLGVGRAVLLRLIDYQSHTSEYGTEWNFFVTLYVLWMLSDSVHHCFSRRISLLFGICILLGYQYALVNTSLTEYILHSPRVGIFASNREGIFSISGCLSLYLLCEAISFTIFFKNSQGDSAAMHRIKMRWMCELVALNVCLVLAWKAADTYQPTSRRLFNLAFVLLCIFVGTFGTCLLLAVELLCESSGPSGVTLLELMNKYQLIVFFFANLLTGAVNISFETIHMDVISSIIVLSVYMLLVTGALWLYDSAPPGAIKSMFPLRTQKNHLSE